MNNRKIYKCYTLYPIMRKIKIQTEKEYYEETCPKCGKSIKGTSESQVKYNLKLHKEKCNKK